MKMLDVIVYVSGKYTAGDITQNIKDARKVATQLWENGVPTICPHLNTANFELDCKATYDMYIDGDLIILDACDIIIMLPGWEGSKGAKIEKQRAELLGMTVIYWTNISHVMTQINEYISEQG